MPYLQNYDPLDRQREFKNPVCAALLPHERARELLMGAVAEANEKALASDKPSFVVEGPLGVEKGYVARIAVDGEFLGCVYAYCFQETVASGDAIQRAARRSRPSASAATACRRPSGA